MIKGQASLGMFDLPFYDPVKGDIKGSIISKARRFIKDHKVVNVKRNHWRIRPITGYNKQVRNVVIHRGVFGCDCQGFKKNRYCSHVLMVQLLQRGDTYE